MSSFAVNGISAGYGDRTVIGDVSFSLEAGVLLGIVGANGCGKTTLLKALCGILPHRGTCVLGDTVLEELSSRQLAKYVSYVPQRSGISIDISALDVVLMGFNPQLKFLEHPTKKMKERALKALDQVGLTGQAETNYLCLSEGQKQLCILARTLVSDSRLLLLDEPESALDFRFRHRMLSLLRDWIITSDRSAIVTLHDPILALNFCDKLLLLSDGAVLDILHPQADPLEKMEQQLSRIYGPVSLHRCANRKGDWQIVMLGEDGK